MQAGTLQDRKHINRMCLYIKRNENYSLPGYIVKTTAPKFNEIYFFLIKPTEKDPCVFLLSIMDQNTEHETAVY